METENEIKSMDCDTGTYKCKSCGATMEYDPTNKQLICNHCGSTEKIFTKFSTELAYEDTIFDIGSRDWSNECVTYRCKSCGAISQMSKYEVATVCPFCSTSNIVKVDDLPSVKPNAVIPFSIAKERINLLFKNWLKKRIFSPNNLKKILTVDKIKGIYTPCWTYDTATIARYQGVLGRIETKTVGSGKNRHTVTTTKYFPVAGTMMKNYDDILIEASHNFTQKEIDNIGPFATRTASLEYDQKYLAGFSAERYDKDIHQGFQEAKKIIYKDYEKMILARHNATIIQSLDIDLKYNDVKYKYLLLPIWLCSYIYKGKPYRYMVNGMTGKSKGKAPLSPIKVGLTTLGILAVAAIIYFLYIYFRGY